MKDIYEQVTELTESLAAYYKNIDPELVERMLWDFIYDLEVPEDAD